MATPARMQRARPPRRPIPRPVRNLATLVRQFSSVSDAFVDIGETSPEEVRGWLMGYLATLPENHVLCREWNKASPVQQEAVFAHWECLRGKNLRERAAAAVDRHNQRVRRKHPLFAHDEGLLAQIGVRYQSAEEEFRKWREGAEQRHRLARDPNRAAKEPTIEERVRARLRLDEDKSEGGRLSLNQARVWRWLLRYGATPDPNAALKEAERRWPDSAVRKERMRELREWANHRERRYRQEEPDVASGTVTVTRAYPELRAAFGRAYAAIVYLTG